MTDDIATRLAALLDREREILTSGHLDRIEAIAGEKRALAARLAELEGLDPGTLNRLHEMARRNQSLLDAAIQGLQAARARLLEIRRATLRLETYAPNGRLTDLSADRPAVERRA